MPKQKTKTRRPGRFLAAFLGVVLLAYLIFRTGPSAVLQQVHVIGWGLALIIVLGGVNYFMRTYAWRLTFVSKTSRLSLGRLFALRLGSEAAGNFGIAGQVLGDAMRVSLLRRVVSVADSISSVALDRGLYIFTSVLVNVAGLLTAVMLMSSSGKWRIYALIFATVSALLLVTTAVAIRRRWPLFSGAARAVGCLPGLNTRLDRKQSVINSAEEHFLSFYHERPVSFWASLILNLASHGVAILEVYLLFHLLGAKISVPGALIIEALTKLISVIGAINPGNVGTYEGGNMILARLVGITSAAGLTVALCRRARALFWAAIGALCFIIMSRLPEQRNSSYRKAQTPGGATPKLGGEGPAVIILANTTQDEGGFVAELAEVGTLPVLLRDILAAKTLKPSRIIVFASSSHAGLIRDRLSRTGRLPAIVEWRTPEETTLSSLVGEIARTAERVVLLRGSTTYRPALLKQVSEWKESDGALAFITGRELVGIYVLTQTAALDFGSECEKDVTTLEDLHQRMKPRDVVMNHDVPPDSWQHIITSADRLTAERKLDNWLVKPTDGRFARMNRRISIPISHQLIKFPITPNMVTLFTFGVGLASGFFFACGGYWNILMGAFLSVWGSILDGCDGEVARIKLQSSDFGCWLDTICDYIYYWVIFAGLTIGLSRTSATDTYLGWGLLLMMGAGLSFLILGFLRRRMAGKHPETFLAVWQKEAERHSSNPLLYFGRQCEFIVRRCFFPYALFAFSILNIMNVAFVIAAIGSNLAWIIAAYSGLRSSRPAVASRTDTAIVFRAPLDEVERAA